MIKVDFRDGDKLVRSINMPENWDEMTADQVRYVFQEYEKLVIGELTKRQFEILVVYKFLGLLHGPSRRAAFNRDIVNNVSALCQCLSFLYNNPADEIPQLSFRSIQNPLRSVMAGKRALCGPATLCQDLTFGEFRNASMCLNQYFRTEDPASLDECIAHLYRPRCSKANKAGRKVRPVRVDTFDADIRAISLMQAWQKNLIMLWFASCINYLQTGTISIGGEEVELRKLFQESEEPTAQPATWNDLLIQIAKEGTIGNTDAVDDAPLMVILLHMWSNYKENKRNERNIKKAQKS